MELRHLRYLIAAVDEGSLTDAAERLFTSQPSLSRQIRDLEDEIGTPLLTRTARGVTLNAAGTVFVEHARIALAHVRTAVAEARQVAQPTKRSLRLGFLTGQEMDWLPQTMRLLSDQLASVDVTVSSQHSPDLARALISGTLDIAFMRAEKEHDGLVFQTVAQEPLVVVMPGDHRLIVHGEVEPSDLQFERFIGVTESAPVLKRVIEHYFAEKRLVIAPAHRVDNLAMAMSLIVSTGGIALLPAYAKNFMPASVTSRPLKGVAPTVALVVAFSAANRSAALSAFVERLGELAILPSQNP